MPDVRDLSSPSRSSPAPSLSGPTAWLADRNSNGSASQADLTIACLLRLGRRAEAEQFINDLTDERRGGYTRYATGLLHAARGEFDAAFTTLESLLDDPLAGAPARNALVDLLSGRIESASARQDWGAAATLALRAVELSPQDEELRSKLLALGAHAPLALLRVGHRAEAADVWEKLQAADPGQAQHAHCLALLYVHSAKEAESNDRPDEADRLWRSAIRNWGVVIHSTQFWDEWSANRAPSYGKPVGRDDIDKLKRKLTDRLSHEIARFANTYSDRKRPNDAARMNRILMECEIELRSAGAMRDVITLLTARGQNVPAECVCGPLMLEHLAKLEWAHTLLARAQALEPGNAAVRNLQRSLSPWGVAWAMIETQRLDEAMCVLEDRLAEQPGSTEGHDLLALACLRQAVALLATKDAASAVAMLALGLDHVRDAQETLAEIKTLAEEAGVQATARSGSERATIQSAIRTVEQAMEINRTERLRAALASLYVSLAACEYNDASIPEAERLRKARELLERALKIAPGNVKGSEYLAIVLVQLGNKYIERDGHEEAIKLFERAIQLDANNNQVSKTLAFACFSLAQRLAPKGRDHEAEKLLRRAAACDPEHTKEFSQALSGLGVTLYNPHLPATAIRLLRAALELDPGNEHARNNLNIALRNSGMSG